MALLVIHAMHEKVLGLYEVTGDERFSMSQMGCMMVRRERKGDGVKLGSGETGMRGGYEHERLMGNGYSKRIA